MQTRKGSLRRRLQQKRREGTAIAGPGARIDKRNFP